MTIKKVRNIFYHKQNSQYIQKRRNARASSYFSASMIVLMFTIILLFIGVTLIDSEIDSYYNEQPLVQIVLPPENLVK